MKTEDFHSDFDPATAGPFRIKGDYMNHPFVRSNIIGLSLEDLQSLNMSLQEKLNEDSSNTVVKAKLALISERISELIDVQSEEANRKREKALMDLMNGSFDSKKLSTFKWDDLTFLASRIKTSYFWPADFNETDFKNAYPDDYDDLMLVEAAKQALRIPIEVSDKVKDRRMTDKEYRDLENRANQLPVFKETIGNATVTMYPQADRYEHGKIGYGIAFSNWWYLMTADPVQAKEFFRYFTELVKKFGSMDEALKVATMNPFSNLEKGGIESEEYND